MKRHVFGASMYEWRWVETKFHVCKLVAAPSGLFIDFRNTRSLGEWIVDVSFFSQRIDSHAIRKCQGYIVLQPIDQVRL